jgi:hypothetical protein
LPARTSLKELEELLVRVLALEAVEDRLELLLDRLVLLLHPRDDRRRVLVLADREGDDGLQDVRLGIERVREVRRLDRVDVAERVRVVAGHEVGPRLLEERVEPVLAADVDTVPVLDGCRQLGRSRSSGRHCRRGERTPSSTCAPSTGRRGRACGPRPPRPRPPRRSPDDALERLHGRHRLAELHVRDAHEELGLHEVLALPSTFSKRPIASS